IWEHPDVKPVPPVPAQVPGGPLAALWWGLAPLGALVLAAGALVREQSGLRLTRAALIGALRWLRRVGFALTLALLALWWMRVLSLGHTPDAYFTYDSVIVYGAELAVAVSLSLWLAERALRGERLRFGPLAVGLAGLALMAAAALSALVSSDPL